MGVRERVGRSRVARVFQLFNAIVLLPIHKQVYAPLLAESVVISYGGSASFFPSV